MSRATCLFRAAALALPLLIAEAASASEVKLYRNRIFASVSVNGEQVEGLLDSGAEMTILDDDFARKLGLSPAGEAVAQGSGAASMKASFANGLKIVAAGVSLTDRTAGIVDLDEVSRRLVGRPVQVIIGRDLFDAARFRLDMEQGQLSTLSPTGKPDGEHFRLTPHRGLETFPVSVEGRPPAQAAFDLGNGSEVMVGKAYAEKIGLTADGRITGATAGGGIGGGIVRKTVTLRSLQIGSRTFKDVPATIDETPSAADLNIGTSILRQFIITTDFKDKSIWLESRR